MYIVIEKMNLKMVADAITNERYMVIFCNKFTHHISIYTYIYMDVYKFYQYI